MPFQRYMSISELRERNEETKRQQAERDEHQDGNEQDAE